MMVDINNVKEIIIDEAQNVQDDNTKVVLYNILNRLEDAVSSTDINHLIQKLNDDELTNQHRIKTLDQNSLFKSLKS